MTVGSSADVYGGDNGIVGRVYDRNRARAFVGYIGMATVGADCDTVSTRACRDVGNNGVGRRVNHRNVVLAIVSYIGATAVRAECDKIGCRTCGYVGGNRVRGGINDRNEAALTSYVDKWPIGANGSGSPVPPMVPTGMVATTLLVLTCQ